MSYRNTIHTLCIIKFMFLVKIMYQNKVIVVVVVVIVVVVMMMMCSSPGFLEPSGGTAVINGSDIRTDIQQVRRNLGLCPQHNILFDLLTVEEHLHFFAKVTVLCLI